MKLKPPIFIPHQSKHLCCHLYYINLEFHIFDWKQKQRIKVATNKYIKKNKQQSGYNKVMPWKSKTIYWKNWNYFLKLNFASIV